MDGSAPPTRFLREEWDAEFPAAPSRQNLRHGGHLGQGLSKLNERFRQKERYISGRERFHLTLKLTHATDTDALSISHETGGQPPPELLAYANSNPKV